MGWWEDQCGSRKRDRVKRTWNPHHWAHSRSWTQPKAKPDPTRPVLRQVVPTWLQNAWRKPSLHALLLVRLQLELWVGPKELVSVWCLGCRTEGIELWKQKRATNARTAELRQGQTSVWSEYTDLNIYWATTVVYTQPLKTVLFCLPSLWRAQSAICTCLFCI